MGWQIAIDGPAASGKSTVAKAVAKQLHLEYLDTGAMYRAVALKAVRLGIDPENEEEYRFLDSTAIDFLGSHLYLDGEDVTKEIRTKEIAEKASFVSKFGYVRDVLASMQRELARSKNIIMDGRDIGTVVLPKADLKIYLDAEPKIRAERRLKEREEKREKPIDLSEMIEELKDRDYQDSHRLISPLRQADDAVYIDTSKLSVNEVTEKVTNLVFKRGYRMEELTQKDVRVEETEEKTSVEETVTEIKEATEKEPEVPEAGREEQPEAKAETKAESDSTEAEEPKKKATKKPRVTKKSKKGEAKAAEEPKVETKEEPKEETSEEEPKVETKEEPKETSEEEPKEAPKVETKEEPKETSEEEPKEAPKETSKEEPKETSEETSEEAPKEPSEETSKEEPKVEPSEETKEEPKETSKEEPKETSEEAPKEEPKEEPEKQYKEMQLVKGVIVEVQEAQPERKLHNKVLKAKEERVLIALEDGQEGYLFRKDTADIDDDDDLFDVFIEGDPIEVVIKKIFPDGGKFIFSTVLLKKRNALIEFEKVVKERPIIIAKVIKQISDFGLLLKYEDFTCLLPSQLASVPKEEFASLIGKDLEVVPIRIDLSRIRVIVSQIHAVSKKQRLARKEFVNQIVVGQVYEGVVKNIESYGAFVEIGEGVEGLLHISEVDHNRISKIEKILNTGDTVTVKVIKIEKDHIGLSRKALLPNYWAEYFEEKKLGDIVTGTVAEINKSGVRVRLFQEVEGFIPKSEYSWDRDVNPADVLKEGDEISGQLIEIAPSKRRIIISVKRLLDNPWSEDAVSEGDIVDVTVNKIQEGGFRISYKGLTGYMSKGTIRSRDPESIREGETIKAKVRLYDPDKLRFIVSMRDAEGSAPRNGFNRYRSQDKMSNTIGDYLSELKKK